MVCGRRVLGGRRRGKGRGYGYGYGYGSGYSASVDRLSVQAVALSWQRDA
jgi:hypothetical protein